MYNDRLGILFILSAHYYIKSVVVDCQGTEEMSL